jgi:hypothetical protein
MRIERMRKEEDNKNRKTEVEKRKNKDGMKFCI